MAAVHEREILWLPPISLLDAYHGNGVGAGKRSYVKKKQLFYHKCITKSGPRLCRRALSTPFVTLFANKRKRGS